MTTPNRFEMSDLPLPDIAQGHQNRMEEMVSRPANPPPFAVDLPQRPPSQRYRRWLLPGILLFLLLCSLGANGMLTLFLAKEKSTNNDLQTRLADKVASTTTSNLIATMTANHTVTVTPRPTCDPLQKLRSATNFCAMVNDCNDPLSDTPKFDCMSGNFCNLNLQCKLNGNSLSSFDLNPQMAGCCGWCGCYENHPGVIWLDNKARDHKFGIIAETKITSGLSARAKPTAVVSIETPGAAVFVAPLAPPSEMQSSSIVLATPKTSGATRRWRKWWSRTGVRHGIRKVHREWMRRRVPY